MDLPKDTGRVGERGYAPHQACFFTLDTSQRSSKAHVLVANLCRNPYHHAFVGLCLTAQFPAHGCMVFWAMHKPCTAVQRLALQTFAIHKVLKLGVFLTSQARRMTQAYSLRTACSHRNRGTESLLYEILSPVGYVGCFISRLLHGVSSSSACCSLVQSVSCTEEVKIEFFLFQNSSRAGGLSPTHLPNGPTGAGTTGTYFPYLFSHDTSHSLPLHCRVGLKLCCPACRGTLSSTGLTSLSSSYVVAEDSFPITAGNVYTSLYRWAFFPAVSGMSSVRTESPPQICINKRIGLALGSL